MKPAIHRLARRGLAALLLLVVASATLSQTGCAVIDEDHRKLTNAMWVFVPNGTGPRVATSVLWVPAGTVTLLADGLAINPVLNMPDAADDAGMAFTMFGVIAPLEIVLLPVRAVGFVALFVGSDVARCSIPYVF